MAERLSPGFVTALFLGVALILLPFADLSVAGHDPWPLLGRMLAGFARPDFGAVETLAHSLALTVAFAVAGVALGAAAGFVMAPFYDRRAIRAFCIALRSVHEIFWALLLIQAIGIGAPKRCSDPRIASGRSCISDGTPIRLTTATATCGPMTRLMMGTDTSAAPKPMKAPASIASTSVCAAGKAALATPALSISAAICRGV